MPTLRATLASLSQSFADSVLGAIRGASLEELLEEATECCLQQSLGGPIVLTSCR